MQSLLDLKCFLLDMDGTIYLGNQLIPGADEFLDVLRKTGREFFFLTNNSSRDKGAYVQKLSSLGIEAEPAQVITSGEATAIYLQTINPGARLFVLGTENLAREFTSQGFSLAGRQDNPDYVVLGFDTTLTYQKLWDACDLVRSGVDYVATHPDFNCPLEGGKYMPDAGAIIAFIEASTGRCPKVIGKPNREIIDAVLSRTRSSREHTAVVGDRLYTDIAMGRQADLTSILVLSGETKREDLTGSDFQPDFILPSVLELGKILGSD